MAQLGYQRYGAVGSDWGTSVSASLGQQDPGHVVGVHLVPPLAPPLPGSKDRLRTETSSASLSAAAYSHTSCSDRAGARPSSAFPTSATGANLSAADSSPHGSNPRCSQARLSPFLGRSDEADQQSPQPGRPNLVPGPNPRAKPSAYTRWSTASRCMRCSTPTSPRPPAKSRSSPRTSTRSDNLRAESPRRKPSHGGHPASGSPAGHRPSQRSPMAHGQLYPCNYSTPAGHISTRRR